MKGKNKLYDLIGIVCGLFLVCALVVGIVTAPAAPAAAESAAEGAPAALRRPLPVPAERSEHERRRDAENQGVQKDVCHGYPFPCFRFSQADPPRKRNGPVFFFPYCISRARFRHLFSSDGIFGALGIPLCPGNVVYCSRKKSAQARRNRG